MGGLSEETVAGQRPGWGVGGGQGRGWGGASVGRGPGREAGEAGAPDPGAACGARRSTALVTDRGPRE